MSSGIFWSNCLVWAVTQWLRHGGYLVCRRSRVWFGPHVLWLPAPCAPLQHFVPISNATARVGWRIHWLIWFRGHVITGDSDKCPGREPIR
jgi:hypothetical protein